MSDDPSLVDSATLLRSLIRDIDEASACHLQAYRWLQAARVTAYELQRRQDSPQAPPPGGAHAEDHEEADQR